MTFAALLITLSGLGVWVVGLVLAGQWLQVAAPGLLLPLTLIVGGGGLAGLGSSVLRDS